MRIKKILGTVGLVGNILNQKSSSKKDAYSCDYVNKLNTYSEEEQRIGTWLGKPLYRKVVTATTPSEINVGTDIYNASSLNIDMLVNIKHALKGEWNEFASNDTVFSFFSRINLSENTRQITCKITDEAYTNKNFYLILEYTKTTD